MPIQSLICAVYTALALAATTAQAIPMLQYSGSNIVGVTGLTVGSDTYDATFLSGSFFALYNNDPTLLYTASFASAADTSLYQFLQSLDINTYQAGDFAGCSADFTSCYLATVRGISDTYITAVDVTVSDTDSPILGALSAPGDSAFPDVSFLRWAPAQSPVTEPPVSLLLASGLIVFGVTRRMRRA